MSFDCDRRAPVIRAGILHKFPLPDA